MSRCTFAAEVLPIIGGDAAELLVAAYGGLTIPVPKRASARGELRYQGLAAAIGDDAAALLCQHYGGTDLYVPRGARALQLARDTVIRDETTIALRQGDETMRDIVNRLARRYGLTARRVWDIVNSLPEETDAHCVPVRPGQLSLFD